MAWQAKVLTAESDVLSPMHPHVPHGIEGADSLPPHAHWRMFSPHK